MATKAELARVIDGYADAKASGNRYLVEKMIEELEIILDEVFGPGQGEAVEAPGIPEVNKEEY